MSDVPGDQFGRLTEEQLMEMTDDELVAHLLEYGTIQVEQADSLSESARSRIADISASVGAADSGGWAGADASGELALGYDGRPLSGWYRFVTDEYAIVYVYRDGSNDYDGTLPPLPDVGEHMMGRIVIRDGVVDQTTDVEPRRDSWGETDSGTPEIPLQEDTVAADTTTEPAPPATEWSARAEPGSAPPDPRALAQQVDDRNHLVVTAMVARHASDSERRVGFMMTDELVLLGDGHAFQAVDALGPQAVTGTVRFKRNRLSANEFVLESSSAEVDMRVLGDELLKHIADDVIYEYGDAERVRVH
jgi:hypothetical protein